MEDRQGQDGVVVANLDVDRDRIAGAVIEAETIGVRRPQVDGLVEAHDDQLVTDRVAVDDAAFRVDLVNLEHDVRDHLDRGQPAAAADRGKVAGDHAGDGKLAERFHTLGQQRVTRIGDIHGGDAALAEREINNAAVDIEVVHVSRCR